MDSECTDLSIDIHPQEYMGEPGGGGRYHQANTHLQLLDPYDYWQENILPPIKSLQEKHLSNTQFLFIILS